MIKSQESFMEKREIAIRYFFSTKGELPWELYGGEKTDWELAEKKIVPFGSAEFVQVWENTKVSSQTKEHKD